MTKKPTVFRNERGDKYWLQERGYRTPYSAELALKQVRRGLIKIRTKVTR